MMSKEGNMRSLLIVLLIIALLGTAGAATADTGTIIWRGVAGVGRLEDRLEELNMAVCHDVVYSHGDTLTILITCETMWEAP
jgi:hypothetical protein